MAEELDTEINTFNEFALHSGENLPNHSLSLKGRGKFIAAGVPGRPMWRTKQEAYRFCGWLLSMAELLPDEEGAHSFEEIHEAIRNA